MSEVVEWCEGPLPLEGWNSRSAVASRVAGMSPEMSETFLDWLEQQQIPPQKLEGRNETRSSQYMIIYSVFLQNIKIKLLQKII